MGSILPLAMILFLMLSVSSVTADGLLWQWKGKVVKEAPKKGLPDEIARFLHSHLHAGDTVQPLDWTSGAVHALWLARAPLATRFVYDFHFYHHVSHPYIIRLRREFIEAITSGKPRFIVDITGDRAWPNGIDTTREFPELKSFMECNYATVSTGMNYRILERK